MSRSPSVPLTEYDDLSSPDPLATSVNTTQYIVTSPSKRQTRSMINKKQQRSSKSTRNSNSDFIIQTPISPSRTVTEQTLSPWKIRVTVEAEPEQHSSDRMQTYTRTVKIPLRDDGPTSISANDKVSSGRGRSGSRVEPKIRSPIKSRQKNTSSSGGKSRRQSVTDLDIIVLGDDDEESEWGKSSRKTSPRKNKSRKSTTRNNDVGRSGVIVEDMDVQRNPGTNEKEEENLAIHSDTPELREIDLNRVSVRQRASSTKQKLQDDRQEIPDISSVEHPSRSGSGLQPGPSAIRKISINSARSYPTPSPTPSEREEDVRRTTEMDREHNEGFDTIMESEGFTMIDLDSLPSAGQFRSSPAEQTLSGLPVRQVSVLNTFATQCMDQNVQLQSQAKPYPSYLTLAEGESDISSHVSSSPPIPRSQAKPQQVFSNLQVPSSAAQARQRLVTPLTYSSPKLPSPPKPAPIKERLTPDSAKVMRAGLTLQGALEPRETNAPQSNPPNSENAQAARSNFRTESSSSELFGGFDSGTQCEMRAGLRFGEELAKRQKEIRVMQETVLGSPVTDVQPHIWRGEHVLRRTPPPSAALDKALPQDGLINNTCEPFTLTQKEKSEDSIEPSEAQSLPESRTTALDTQARKEKLWQHERDVIIKQAQEASPSKVIVVDSEDEGSFEQERRASGEEDNMEETDGDIWLAEAKDSSSSPQTEVASLSVLDRSDNRHHNGESKSFYEKPRRSIIPSPWKRGQQFASAGNESSVLTTGDGESAMSGLFWKQPRDEKENLRFGAQQLKDFGKELNKSGRHSFGDKRSSGSFDLEKMIRTPERNHDTLGTEADETGSSKADEEDSSYSNIESSAAIEEDEHIEAESTPVPDRKIAINFNDSIASEIVTPIDRPTTPASPGPRRPPTPRSALKGTRQSFGAPADSSDGSGQIKRKVVFARRSCHVDEHWVESSSSIRSEAITSPMSNLDSDVPSVAQNSSKERDQPLESANKVQISQVPNQSSWFGWLTSNQDGTMAEPSNIPQQDGSDEFDQEWQPTSKCVSSPSSSLSEDISPTPLSAISKTKSVREEEGSYRTSSAKSKSKSIHKLPSYLLPPSYPTDPKRRTSEPLLPLGEQTTSHLRTLHILHAKSHRARFHAPDFSSCRPEIQNLVFSGWKLDVNEESSGLGRFEFKIGELEGRVLERFCREIEIGVLRRSGCENGGDVEVEPLVGRGGIWGGREGVGHGKGDVEWGWRVEELATWLGRIVVGEVVRAEEKQRKQEV